MAQERDEDCPKLPTTVCGKDFVSQFDKLLQVSSSLAKIPRSRPDIRAVSASNPSGSVVKRRRKKRVKKAFVLRPSKLQVQSSKSQPPEGGNGVGEAHFSFENCSKELESIIQTAHNTTALIRPRSSSLPSSSSSSRKASSEPSPLPASADNYTKVNPGGLKSASSKVSNKCGTGINYESAKSCHFKSREKLGKRSRKAPRANLSDNATCDQLDHRNHHHQHHQSTCAQQAMLKREVLSQDVDRLADYLEDSILLPKKMSYMAEMMYT